MSNFVKLPRQIKKSSIQGMYFNRYICMPAICYNGWISAVPSNAQLHGEKQICEKFQIVISKPNGLFFYFYFFLFFNFTLGGILMNTNLCMNNYW